MIETTGLMLFDGQTLRIEFGVTRFDGVKPNAPITRRRYPACRLVLPPAAAVDLINRMQQIAAALKQAELVRQAQRGAGKYLRTTGSFVQRFAVTAFAVCAAAFRSATNS